MRKATLYFIVSALCAALAWSCASIGTPSGGPRDEDPPKFVSSTPPQGAVEVTPQKAVLTFDELVNLKDAFSKVVVSPPSATTPRVSSLGRRVTVEFRDTLLPNTTYTVDFGDAIVDNNEGNKLENFIYTFSTGPVLDSLMVSGMVLGASDLAPEAGIYVGLHTNPEDSAFTKTRFDRIAKTNEEGKFVIGGLAPGRYRIYALDDRDNNLAWTSPEETLAFYDYIIEPASERTVATDTIFDLLTGTVDTIVKRERTRFVPNNILLRSYNTGFRQQYITKYERVDSTRINLIFNAPADSMATVDILTPQGGAARASDVAVIERSATNDTLALWIHDRDIIATDTLRLAVTYLRADSVYNMVPVNDTLRVITQRPNVKTPKVVKNKKEEVADTLPAPVPTIILKALNGKPEVYESFTLEAPVPLDTFIRGMVHLEFKEDTIWKAVADFDPGGIATDSLNPRRLRISHPWEFETQYRITVDSLAGKDIYGIFTDDLTAEFTIRAESEYGTIKFNLSNFGTDTIPHFVDLLDSNGKTLRTGMLENGSITFRYLMPGKYNARVVEDTNGNGRWDPGIFEQGVQPDVAYYYPETIDLKANWDQEIDWNVFRTPVDKMLPETLRKNKKSNSRNY